MGSRSGRAFAVPCGQIPRRRSISSALASIDGKDVNEGKMADYFLDRLADRDSPTSLRVMALQMAPPNHPRLTLPLLTSKLGGLSYFRIRQWLLQKDQTGAYSH